MEKVSELGVAWALCAMRFCVRCCLDFLVCFGFFFFLQLARENKKGSVPYTSSRASLSAVRCVQLVSRLIDWELSRQSVPLTLFFSHPVRLHAPALVCVCAQLC